MLFVASGSGALQASANPVVSGKTTAIRCLTSLRTNGLTGEETILLDDFDKKGVCLSHYLKRWADHYPCTGETKGGTVHLRHKRLVITSQYNIETLFGKPDEDGAIDQELLVLDALHRRFKVIHMNHVNNLGKKRARS